MPDQAHAARQMAPFTDFSWVLPFRHEVLERSGTDSVHGFPDSMKIGAMVICSRVPPRAGSPRHGRVSNFVRERLSSRRALAMIGLFTLTCGLFLPTPGRSQDSIVRGQTALEVTSPAAEPYYDFVNPLGLNSRPLLKQSLFGFAGGTNSGNLGDTFAFGIGAPRTIFYDNYIVGGAYQRDLLQFNSGILIGAEVGIADRFGHYQVCCDTIVYSSGITHSAELWGGITFRHEGLALFDTVRISPGFVFGLSAVSSPNRTGSPASIRPSRVCQGAFLPGL